MLVASPGEAAGSAPGPPASSSQATNSLHTAQSRSGFHVRRPWPAGAADASRTGSRPGVRTQDGTCWQLWTDKQNHVPHTVDAGHRSPPPPPPHQGLTPRLWVPTEYLQCVPQEKSSRGHWGSFQVIISKTRCCFSKAEGESQQGGRRLKRPGTTQPTERSAAVRVLMWGTSPSAWSSVSS